MSNITVGKKGEKLAADYLAKLGYKILETNKRFSRICELDIIALDKDTLVCCEVKTRTDKACGEPAEAITGSKYKNIKTGLYYYLQEHPEYKKFRIDAVSIVLNPVIEIKHFRNV